MKSICGTVLIFVLSFQFLACSESPDEKNTASSEPAFSAAEAAGTALSACQTIADGSVLSGTSYVRQLNLNNDGTYFLNLTFYTQSHCGSGGGDHFMAFSQSGIWSVEGGSPIVNASQLKFRLSGDPTLTVHGATSLGHDIAGYLNAACATTFNHSATKTLAVTSLSCVRNASPSLNWTFPGNNEVLFNAGILTNTPKVLRVANPSVVWYPGELGDFPSALNLDLGYQ